MSILILIRKEVGFWLLCQVFMAKINFFALGGVQENGKNLYVVEINDRLYILDCGLKYPTSELYGVDVIVNDISYLEENASRMYLFITCP